MSLRPVGPDDEPRILTAQEESGISPAILRALRDALQTIRFGAVELVIHEGRVVQLELRQKVRFETEVSSRRR